MAHNQRPRSVMEVWRVGDNGLIYRAPRYIQYIDDHPINIGSLTGSPIGSTTLVEIRSEFRCALIVGNARGNTGRDR